MKKILVVEDNPDNSYLITFALNKAGYKVILAERGDVGVDLAARELPDLILMDIKLPGIDGLEATRRIRVAEFGKTVPIVALTSHALSGDRKRAMDAGCTGYMEKPLDPDTFLQEVAAYLKDRK